MTKQNFYLDEAKKTRVTADQMIDAPRGALYVWHNEDFIYARKLADKLHRSDLVIVSPKMFDGGGYRLRGRYVGVIIDHATTLNDEQKRVVDLWTDLSGDKKK